MRINNDFDDNDGNDDNDDIDTKSYTYLDFFFFFLLKPFCSST